MCPICGGKTIHQSWSEDYWGTVESWTDCYNCGFRAGYSYGGYEMTFGEFEFYWSHNMKYNNRLSMNKKIKEDAWKFRKSLVRKRKHIGKGNIKYM
jgi:hypothetical protein